jgi:leucyl/phenylalanyl-tRNA--protein transferase
MLGFSALMAMTRDIQWLEPGQPFPPVSQAWGTSDPAPGLLAVGSALDVATLRRAYSQGIFPWFNEGQPILWWSPDPRMVLQTERFKLHRSLRQTLKSFLAEPGNELRMDTAFSEVIRACANSRRRGQKGTWIVGDMISAYEALHADGVAHSIEIWAKGQLTGGLYCLGVGGAVFGESMFSRESNASKLALAGLVAFCRHNRITHIDCQQNTHHLASLGAMEMSRTDFLVHLRKAILTPSPDWYFDSVYWDTVLKR